MSRVHDVALLLGRTVLGSYLVAHGAQKLFGAFDGPGLDPVAAGFDLIGLRPGRHMAKAAAVSEIGGGVLTATGLAYPLGPIALAGTMAVAASTHRANGPLGAKGGYELPLSNMAAALTLAAAGPGRLSLGPSLPKPLARLVMAGAATSAAVLVSMVVRTSRAASSPEMAPADTRSEAAAEEA
jgi:putative oxidoreductase